MPTAAKLVAFLAFAAVGFFAAELFKPGLPETTRWGWFTAVSSLIGGLCGWNIAGPEAGRGWSASISTGLRTIAVIFLIGLLVFSAELMIARSMMHQYGGIFEAILGMFDIMLFYGRAFLAPEPMIALFMGGLLAALLTEWTSRQAR